MASAHSAKCILTVYCFCRLDRKGALHAFAKKLAPLLIDPEKIAGRMKRVGGTPSRAIKLRPTVAASFSRQKIEVTVGVLKRIICNAVPYIAHEKGGIIYQLMAWVKIARRCDR